MSTIQELKPRQLRPAKVALRTEVDKKSLAYQELLNSVRRDGLINSISDEPCLNSDGTHATNDHGENMFEIADGLHRWTVCTDLNLDVIPVVVLSKNERGMLATQIAANSTRIETKRVQYAQALKQIMQNGAMTLKEVAALVGKSEVWVAQQLSLTHLPASVQKLIDDNMISAMNAVTLAKLGTDSIEEFIQAALTEPTATFQEKVDTFIREKRKAMAQGRQIDRSFKPSATLRKSIELKGLLEDPTPLTAVVKGISDPVQAALAVVKWTLHLDPESVAEQKNAYDVDEAKKAALAAKKKEEKDAKAALLAQTV